MTATNAVDALSIIYYQPISLLLLDVQMPDITGLEFCRTVRSLPQFQHLPVIMVTSQDLPLRPGEGASGGCNRISDQTF